MTHYVLLTNFTDQGVRSVKDTVKRADAFKQMAEKSGVKVHALFWNFSGSTTWSQSQKPMTTLLPRR